MIPSKEFVLKYGFPFLPRLFYTSSWMWWDFLKDMSTGTSQDVSFFSVCMCCCIILVGLKNTKCLHWCPSPGEFLFAAPSSLGALQHSAGTLLSVWNHKTSLTTGGFQTYDLIYLSSASMSFTPPAVKKITDKGNNASFLCFLFSLEHIRL